MVKVMLLLKRKPGLSREEFSRRYEEVHAPLVLSHLRTMKKYVRNYAIASPGAGEPDFDCITEVWFDNMKELKRVQDFYQSDVGEVIRNDEERFIDRSKMLSFLVEEKASS